MKAECGLEKLRMIIPVVERVTGKNLTLNILSSVLIISNGKTIKFRATNLDIGIEVELSAKIIKEGVVAVSGSVLNELISNLKDDKTIILESAGDNLNVVSKNNNAVVKCYPYSDFPTIPLITGDVYFNIEGNKLLSGIKSVVYSASLSDIKPEISSVYIYPEGEDMVFVATDSFRLAEKRVKTKNLPDFGGIIIPYKNILEMIRVVELSDGEVKVCFNKNQVSVSYDGVYFTSRLINGNFPDYKQIIPKDRTTEAVLLKQDLINALKVSNIFLDKFSQINMEIKPKSKKFVINSKNSDLGETKTELQASLKGEDVSIHLNYRYLFDVFQSISSDSVSMDFSGNTKPVVVRGVSDKSFMYLVMPLNR